MLQHARRNKIRLRIQTYIGASRYCNQSNMITKGSLPHERVAT